MTTFRAPPSSKEGCRKPGLGVWVVTSRLRSLPAGQNPLFPTWAAYCVLSVDCWQQPVLWAGATVPCPAHPLKNRLGHCRGVFAAPAPAHEVSRGLLLIGELLIRLMWRIMLFPQSQTSVSFTTDCCTPCASGLLLHWPAVTLPRPFILKRNAT